MFKEEPQPQNQSKSRYKNWVINLLILMLATILMLVVAEETLRWFDGYSLSGLKLNQDTTITTPLDQKTSPSNAQ